MDTSSVSPIVVGVDGSESSLRAVLYAAELSTALQIPLRVVTTWDFPAMLIGESGKGNWSPEGDARHIQSNALERAFHGKPPANLRKSILEGPAARVLIHESKRAHLLVVGNRGRGGFTGLIIGSVSTACAQHAHCPVLIVRGDLDLPPSA
jgi:nucleotide-binding universal stress UspA family protein